MFFLTQFQRCRLSIPSPSPEHFLPLSQLDARRSRPPEFPVGHYVFPSRPCWLSIFSSSSRFFFFFSSPKDGVHPCSFSRGFFRHFCFSRFPRLGCRSTQPASWTFFFPPPTCGSFRSFPRADPFFNSSFVSPIRKCPRGKFVLPPLWF